MGIQVKAARLQTSNKQLNIGNRFQTTDNQFNSDNQFQSNNQQSSSLQSINNQQNSPSRVQSNVNQRNFGSGLSTANNQQNFDNQFQSNNQQTSSGRSQSNFNQQNINNRFSQRSGSSFESASDSIDGAFEPLNLPSGASFLLGSISTSFSCLDRPYGYYADQENSCRLFHICNPTLFSNGAVETYQYSFMCGEGSMFDQSKLTCVAESEAIPCQESSSFFFTNEQFGRPEEKTF